ncbi:NAD(P)/FAD-dependent oxidoreductase [Blautia sp. MSJ-19]|uniref:NAD(P)/FAD-dependent oxidoreductase n=1 Tax=Blautia sp. MSJ-19 TaxID=2841517 RepID=UPI001C0F0367|nr:NAD(P)/FAD-dependent oxidoreductase [Blautia sp. MSJ-19]MBU5481504.1 NAD(P)/FAD-dependent oxidoreductase [Blautia sp. MSJ-19]
MSEKTQVIVVGGGASGLMAAIQAAENGAAVTVLEQNETPGRKICVTGNGRCNLTNRDMRAEIFRGRQPEFAAGILQQFSLQDTLTFFEKLGVALTDRKGWLYPRSNQAKCIPELLLLKARSLKVKIKTRESVESVFYENGCWKVQTSGWTYEGNKVILANGSSASQVPGSDGSGYEIASQLGHRIIKPLPALTGLRCKGNAFSAWAGVRTDAEVTLLLDETETVKESGEVQLTDYGISGIPIFQLSRYAIRALDGGKKVTLSVNFLPEYTKDTLQEYMKKRQELCPYQSEAELLLGLLPDKLIKMFRKQKGDLCQTITAYSLVVKGSSGFEQAQVCSGGVDTSQVSPETLESKLHKGLYFAGELLDIDGPCGGYNLQWAWSSGAVAGCHSAKEKL